MGEYAAGRKQAELLVERIEQIFVAEVKGWCYNINILDGSERYKMETAKPLNRIQVIRQENTEQFIREFNKNKVSKEFMESCEKAGKLFGKDDNMATMKPVPATPELSGKDAVRLMKQANILPTKEAMQKNKMLVGVLTDIQKA